MSDELKSRSKSTDEEMKTIARARELTRKYFLTDYDDKKTRSEILGELFGSIGENVVVDTPLHCDYGKNVHIGNDVIINMNCTFVDDAKITIGNRVLIASNVQFYTGTHPVEPKERFVENRENGEAWFRTCFDEIKIEDGAWLGGGVIVLPGVTVGRNSVIGAGSVVTRSIPENCVAVGNPCRPIRFFDEK